MTEQALYLHTLNTCYHCRFNTGGYIVGRKIGWGKWRVWRTMNQWNTRYYTAWKKKKRLEQLEQYAETKKRTFEKDTMRLFSYPHQHTRWRSWSAIKRHLSGISHAHTMCLQTQFGRAHACTILILYWLLVINIFLHVRVRVTVHTTHPPQTQEITPPWSGKIIMVVDSGTTEVENLFGHVQDVSQLCAHITPV